MLRISNKKRVKSTVKNVDKKPQYQEDFNEIILNDLVEDDRKIEFGIDEAPSTSQRKKGGLKFNFGLKNKKSQNNDNNPQDKNKPDVHKAKDKISEKSTKKEKGSNKGNSPSKSGVETNKEKISDKKNVVKKEKHNSDLQQNKTKSKGIKKGKSVPNNQKKEQGKKTHSKNTNIQRQNNINEETELINCVNRDIEEYKKNCEDNMSSFRSKDEEIKTNKEDQSIENKLKDLIWSEDKFPKN